MIKIIFSMFLYTTMSIISIKNPYVDTKSFVYNDLITEINNTQLLLNMETSLFVVFFDEDMKLTDESQDVMNNITSTYDINDYLIYVMVDTSLAESNDEMKSFENKINHIISELKENRIDETNINLVNLENNVNPQLNDDNVKKIYIIVY